jgi:hypothetical protein
MMASFLSSCHLLCEINALRFKKLFMKHTPKVTGFVLMQNHRGER